MLRVLLSQGKLGLQQETLLGCMALLLRNFIQSEVRIHTSCSKRVTSFFNSFYSSVANFVARLDGFRFLANCSSTPPVSLHFALSEK